MRAADATVLVTPRSFASVDPAPRTRLEAAVGEVRGNDLGRPMTAGELRERVGDIDALLAGLDEIDASVFAAAPRLRVIARYGAGVDRIDLRAAAEHGVVVTNTPGANAEAVAEFALGLILAGLRRIAAGDRTVRDGAWAVQRGRELAGSTVGLLGLGRIGAATARRLVALGARVVAFDPAVAEAPPGVLLLSRDEVVAQADVLSLHLPALPATRDMVDAALLARMPRGALLVNTARGELVVEEDLVAALDAGHLAGAALDTLRDEPPAPDHPLLGRPDVIVTPHAAPHTREAVTAMGLTAVQELLTVLEDGTPRFPVPPTGDRA